MITPYVTVEEAMEYLGHRLGGKDWVTADDDTKEQSLIMATQNIDNTQFIGQLAIEGQEHSFPRMIWSNSTSTYIAQSDVPQAVKDACCEEALFLTKYGNNERITMQALGVTRAAREGVAEEYVKVERTLLSPQARAILRKYMVGGVPIRR